MSWVRAMFFHIWTQLADQDPKPEPSLFTKRIFFSETRTRPTGPRGPHRSPYALPDLGTICSPNRGPTKKIELKPKKKKKKKGEQNRLWLQNRTADRVHQ